MCNPNLCHKFTKETNKQTQNDMSIQLQLNIEKLESLKGQLNYINHCLNQSDIEKWEKIECLRVKGTIQVKIFETEELIETIKIL